MPHAPGIEYALRYIDGQHYLNAEGQGRTMLDQLSGEIHALQRNGSDDPLLYAYQLRDALPRVAGLVVQLQSWSNRVLDADDPSLPDTGAQLCR